jgi:hypothetical protein
MENKLNLKLIVGYLRFIDLETGYWQLSEDEDKYRIKNMPENLKHENLRIAALVEIIENEMSVFMSGKSINLIEYKIIKS